MRERGARAHANRKRKPMVSLYLPVFLMMLVAVVLALVIFTATSLAGPKNMTAEKATPYESGSESTGANHLKLSIKFYLTAILFVVFDIEAVLIYPWAIEFNSLGWVGLASMGSFVALLVVALLYVWKKGALEWET
jgi:NADH-quinone oxidoreductase subunit A